MALHLLELPLASLTRADLPPVCLITGATEGVEYRTVKFTWYPRWISLLAPALLLAAILAAIMTRRATAELPFTPQAYRRWRLGVWGFGLSAVLAVTLFITALVLLATERNAWAAAAFVSSVAIPVAAWFALVRDRQVVVKAIRDDALVLRIPSLEAARAISSHLAAHARGVLPEVASVLATDAAKSAPAPVGSTCASHPQVVANWICGRCGAFFCDACARFPTVGGPPLCARCFEVRAKEVVVSGALGLKRLQTAGFVVGLLALVPGCWPGLVGALIVNGLSLHRTLKVDGRPRQWMPVAGLVCCAVSVVVWVLLLVA
ncbi:MAG: hypothetical protein K1X89_10740 [Myxococcaceae bacterium]|nr:hypothetical protein [Myxococcaceae bacterium]